MPNYLPPDALREVRTKALELAIETTQHFNNWGRQTVLEIAKEYEKFMLEGTFKGDE